MKEFIDKLIGGLEELITDTYYKSVEGSRSAGIENNAYHNVKKIVNQLAEEYKTTYMEELIKAKRICANDCNTDECPFGLGEGKCFLDELNAKLENKEQHNDQNLMIVESLPSLYPMMQPFEIEAIHRVVERGKYNKESVKGDFISRSLLLDCLSYYISHTDEKSGEHYAYEITKDLIEKQPKSYNDGWISCSTDMPDHDEEVFIKFSDGAICNGKFWIAEGTNYCGFNTKFGLFVAEQVMEWKPLNKSYQPKGE